MNIELFELLAGLYQAHLDEQQARLPGLEMWLLDSILSNRTNRSALAKNSHSHRIFTKEETSKLDKRCMAYLLQLEQSKAISAEIREKIIDTALDFEYVDLDDMHFIIDDILQAELANNNFIYDHWKTDGRTIH